jgi:hypothetical protein
MSKNQEELKQEIIRIYNELKDYETLVFDIPVNVKLKPWRFINEVDLDHTLIEGALVVTVLFLIDALEQNEAEGFYKVEVDEINAEMNVYTSNNFHFEKLKDLIKRMLSYDLTQSENHFFPTEFQNDFKWIYDNIVKTSPFF